MTSTETLLQHAEWYRYHERYTRAIGLVNEALEQAPDNSRAHALLSLCLVDNRERPKKAISEAQRAVELSPQDAWTQHVLAYAYESRKQHDNAIEAIQRAISLEPKCVEYHGMLAFLLSNQEQWQPCYEASQAGLALAPGDELCSIYRNWSLIRLDRAHEAIEFASQAVHQSPNSVTANCAAGWTFFAAKNYPQSQAYFRESLRLDVKNENASDGMIRSIVESNVIYRWLHSIAAFLSGNGGYTGHLWWIVLIITMAIVLFSRHIWDVPVPIFLAAFVWIVYLFITWTAWPIFCLALRFHPSGRFTIPRKHLWGYNFIAFILASSALAAICNYLLHRELQDTTSIAALIATAVVPAVFAVSEVQSWVRVVCYAVATYCYLIGLITFVRIAMGMYFRIPDWHLWGVAAFGLAICHLAPYLAPKIEASS